MHYDLRNYKDLFCRMSQVTYYYHKQDDSVQLYEVKVVLGVI